MEVALSFTFSVIGGIPVVISIVLRVFWTMDEHPRCLILDFVETMRYGGARIQAPDMGGIRDSRNGYGVINPSCCLWRLSPNLSNCSCSSHGRFVGFVSYLLNVFVPIKFVIQDYSEVSEIFSVVYGSVTTVEEEWVLPTSALLLVHTCALTPIPWWNEAVCHCSSFAACWVVSAFQCNVT